MKSIVISDEMVLKFALDYGYNMDLFKKYLIYQKQNEDEWHGKWTFEEYALSQFLQGNIEMKDICMCNRSFQDGYARWMGFECASFIPDCVCFERYCSYRDLYQMDLNRENEKQEIKLLYKKQKTIKFSLSILLIFYYLTKKWTKRELHIRSSFLFLFNELNYLLVKKYKPWLGNNNKKESI